MLLTQAETPCAHPEELHRVALMRHLTVTDCLACETILNVTEDETCEPLWLTEPKVET